jgi:hypothetical protein
MHYLEKALKYKPDDNETKRKLETLRAKVKLRLNVDIGMFLE